MTTAQQAIFEALAQHRKDQLCRLFVTLTGHTLDFARLTRNEIAEQCAAQFDELEIIDAAPAL
jgi:3-methyladenine DNA glycosylase AlkD